MSTTISKTEFEKIMVKFIQYTEHNIPNFYNYFYTYYYLHKESPRLPFGLESGFNTNNFAESNFRHLKYTYLQIKTNNRFDMLFTKLVEMSFFIYKESISKYVSNKLQSLSYKQNQSSRNHKKSLKLRNKKFNLLKKPISI